MEVPVNTKGYGIYYQLGNDSVSKIMPGQFDSGELAKYNDKSWKGKGLYYRQGYFVEEISRKISGEDILL